MDRRAVVTTLTLALTASLPGLVHARGNESPACPTPSSISIRVQGAPIHGANGLRFDADGHLHIASAFGREIVVMDPQSGAILDRYTGADGVETPDDLAFGPDGSLYWTAIATGQVGRRTPDGAFSSVAQLPAGVNPITFSPDGRLFVGLCLLGAGLFEVDPTGSTAPRSIRDFPGERCATNGFDFGPDGLLYGPRFFESEVVSINVDSGEMLTVADGFGVPSAAKFDHAQRLHVIDIERGELVRVDIKSGKKHRVARVPRNTDNLVFDETDRVYISGADDGAIREVLANGSLREVSPGGLAFPGGIAVSGEHFFVADHFALVEFDNATGRERSRETSIIDVSALAEPMTVAVAGQNLVLTSWRSNTVQIWDPARARVVQTFADFGVPLNAISFEGGLAVSELLSGSVVLERGGQRTTLAAGLLVPTGLASDGSSLYVADWAAGTITRVSRHGSSVIASGLAGPEGLALDGPRRLLVVESGARRLSEIDLHTGVSRVLADELALGLPPIPGVPPTFAFNGVAVDRAGTAYVTGDVDNVVYAIPKHAPLQHAGPSRRH
jgi:sugar lactone lactonase YvrE